MLLSILFFQKSYFDKRFLPTLVNFRFASCCNVFHLVVVVSLLFRLKHVTYASGVQIKNLHVTCFLCNHTKIHCQLKEVYRVHILMSVELFEMVPRILRIILAEKVINFDNGWQHWTRLPIVACKLMNYGGRNCEWLGYFEWKCAPLSACKVETFVCIIWYTAQSKNTFWMYIIWYTCLLYTSRCV